jgi:hypothetical protein
MRSYRVLPFVTLGRTEYVTTLNSSSITACLFVVAETCLATLYPATDVLPLLRA